MRWPIMLAGLVIVALALSSPCRAEEVTAALDRARQLHREGRFSEAILKLRAVLPTAEREPLLPRRIEGLADAYLQLGLAYAALGDSSTAKDAFKSALQLRPDLSLDADTYSPRIVMLFEQARLAITALEPLAPVGDRSSAAERGWWRLRVEGGVAAACRVHLGGSPTPSFVYPSTRQSESEYDYLLELPSEADGLGASVGVTVERGTGVNRVAARFDSFSISDDTSLSTRIDLVSPSQPLDPPPPDGSEELRVRWFDLLWSRRLVGHQRLDLHLELGYRLARVEQDTRDLVRDFRCTAVSDTYCSYGACAENPPDGCAPLPPRTVRYMRRELRRRAARLDDHGFRVGANLDVRLHGRLHLAARGGITAAVRRETNTVDWIIQDNPESTSYVSPLGSTSSGTGERHLAFDLASGLSLDVGSRLSLALLLRLNDFGPESRAGSDGRIVVGGAVVSLSYTHERRKEGHR